MVLHSPLTTSDTRPLYHISWRQDYFSPLSVVTTIRKGATEDGMFVAEFGYVHDGISVILQHEIHHFAVWASCVFEAKSRPGSKTG